MVDLMVSLADNKYSESLQYLNLDEAKDNDLTNNEWGEMVDMANSCDDDFTGNKDEELTKNE